MTTTSVDSSELEPLRQRLRDLLLARSVSRGDFTLASGRRSSFYIDARRTTMSGEGFALIGALGLERLAAQGWAPQAVGGLTLGADPVAYAIVAAARAIAVVEAAGGRVLGVLAVVDREEGGREALERTGQTVTALVTATELGLA